MKSRIGSGRVSACGGNGLAGGGGGRVSVDIFSRHDDPTVLVHGEIAFIYLFIYVLVTRTLALDLAWIVVPFHSACEANIIFCVDAQCF